RRGGRLRRAAPRPGAGRGGPRPHHVRGDEAARGGAGLPRKGAERAVVLPPGRGGLLARRVDARAGGPYHRNPRRRHAPLRLPDRGRRTRLLSPRYRIVSAPPPLDLQSVVTHGKEQVFCELDGEMVLMSVRHGEYYRLDEVGS